MVVGLRSAVVRSAVVCVVVSLSLTLVSSELSAHVSPPASSAVPTHLQLPGDGIDVPDIGGSRVSDLGAPAGVPGGAAVSQAVPRSSLRTQRQRARTQCRAWLWGNNPNDMSQARALKRNRQIALQHYGTLRLPRKIKKMSWLPQSSLDHSGNGHMHSLFWALPLLRVGVQKKKPGMVKLFYRIINTYVKKNRPAKPRTWYMNSQIVSGFRQWTLACAFDGPAPNRKLLRQAIKREGAYAVKNWQSINNASFHHASGSFASACILRQPKRMKQARQQLGSISSRMIAEDGSVREGSMVYARNTAVWTLQQINRVRSCGQNVPAALNRATRIPAFLAQGTRPDGFLEMLGDSPRRRPGADLAAMDAGVNYVQSRGKSGRAPSSLFSVYQAGFIFGRTGWGTGDRSFARETFYSMRTGPGGSAEYHAHSDAGAVTFASRGSQHLHDTGSYRYSKDAREWFVRSRQAHNVVHVPGVNAGSPRPSVLAARSNAAGDFIMVRDTAYGSRATINRTTWFDREAEFLIVIDDVSTPRRERIVQNWNLDRTRTVTSAVDGQGIQQFDSHGSGSNVSLRSAVLGSQVSTSAADSSAGRTNPWRGWSSYVYGELVPAPSVHLSATGTRMRIATVIVARGANAGPERVSAEFDDSVPGVLTIRIRDQRGEYVRAVSSSGVQVVTDPPSPEPEPSDDGESDDDSP